MVASEMQTIKLRFKDLKSISKENIIKMNASKKG